MTRHPGYSISQALLVVTMACVQPSLDATTTFDISSEEAFEQSKAAMLAELSEEEAKDLEHAFQIIFDDVWRNDVELTFFVDEEVDASNLRKLQEYMQPLHGMTAQELMDYAKTLPNWVTREQWKQDIKLIEQLKCPGYL